MNPAIVITDDLTPAEPKPQTYLEEMLAYAKQNGIPPVEFCVKWNLGLYNS